MCLVEWELLTNVWWDNCHVCGEWKEGELTIIWGKRVMVRATTVMSLNGDLAAWQVLVHVCWVVTGTVWFLD